jgi:hypothetical protein
MGADRRQSPRVAAARPLEARLVDEGLAVSIIDMSFGGFLIESPVPITAGTTHICRVTLDVGDVALDIPVRCVHSRRRDGSTPLVYECGFAISDPHQPTIDQHIHTLMAHLTSVLQID